MTDSHQDLRQRIAPFTKHSWTDPEVVEQWIDLVDAANELPQAFAAALVATARDSSEAQRERLRDLVGALDPAIAAEIVALDHRVGAQLVSVWEARALPPAARAAWIAAAEDGDSREALYELMLGDGDSRQRWTVVAELVGNPDLRDDQRDHLFELLRSQPWAHESPQPSGESPHPRNPPLGSDAYEAAFPPGDERRQRAMLEAEAIDATRRAWVAAGRDPTPWLAGVGRGLAGCGLPSCCGHSLFEHELVRRGYNLRLHPPSTPESG